MHYASVASPNCHPHPRRMLPFRQHWAMLFLCGYVIFVLMALMRSRLRGKVQA